MEKENTGDRLRALRKARGFTLVQLSNATGLTQATLSRYETGSIREIPMESIRILSGVLNATEAELLGLEQTPVSDELTVLLNDLHRQPKEKQEKAVRILRMLLEMND